jgi:GT2 family glycosyltransferase
MPRVSVVIPAWRSHATIAGCLEALAGQSFRDFETIVVDSSPGDETGRIVREGFPAVRFERSPRRLLPHAARNRGAELARGELLVFTDPDCYARPDWLERLLEARRRTGGTVVGALACHGRRWRDQGLHLCKFSKWLPAGALRPVDMSPTANMLISREDFTKAGGFPGEQMLGDVVLSWALQDHGRTLWLAPDAVVAHHHTQSFRDFLAERLTRGRMYGDLRTVRLRERRGALAFYLLVTVLPVRLPRILGLVAGHAMRARQGRLFLATLPIVAAGHAAALAGEAAAYLRLSP